MSRHDTLGNAHSHASANALAGYERALHEFQCFIGDPVASVNAALADSPDFVMGHALLAYLHLLSTEPAGTTVGRQALERAWRERCTPREQAHLAAVEHLVHGRWRAAGRVLEDIALDHPHDVLALQAGHLIDFYTGDARMLRDRIARALPEWSPDMPAYHALLGMHAFGLEETADYAAAERAGRRALELQPLDAWAHHAVAHVLEMQARRPEGIAWMREREPHWSQQNAFAVHNWWHLALQHLALDDIDAVLALFDGPIHGPRSPLALDLVDASALLWRLHLRGVDVGARWQSVADGWAQLAGAGHYAFNDAHAMMAFIGARRPEAAQAVLDAQQLALHAPGDNAFFTREVGAPLCEALHAFDQGHARRCVELLRPLRGRAHCFGGSHAQRDLIDLTLIEAARRDGQRTLLQGLLAERNAPRAH
jgi:hypothetical protein